MRARLRVLLMLCLLLLSACSASTASHVLIAWHTLDGQRERALLKLIDRFNATNRNGIVIVPERRTAQAQHDGLLANQQPHLALVTSAQAALYNQRGSLAQLDGIIAADDDAQRWDDTDRADLFPFVQTAGRTPRGQIIGIPMGGDARVLLRNRDLATGAGLGDMPTTWEQFSKSCTTALNQTSGSVCFSLNPNGDITFLEEWAESHGVSPFSTDTNSLRIDTPEMAQAIAQLLTYLQSGAAYRAQSPQRALEDFAAGRVGYLEADSSRMAEIMAAIHGRGNFNIDVSTWPAASAAAKPVALITALLWVIPKSTPERQRDAWRFVRWLLEDEQTAQWAADTGEVPARASAVNALNLDTVQANSVEAARATVLMHVAPNAKPLPVLSGWPCVQEKLTDNMRQIFDGQSITETLTLAQARVPELVNSDCSMRSAKSN